MRDMPFDIVELVACPEAPPTVGTLRETIFHTLAWLPDEDSALRRLFAADEPMEAIAEAIPSRTFEAVRARVSVLGLRRNSKRPWSDLERRYVADRYSRDPVSTIAQAIGRSPRATWVRAHLDGLTDAAALDFTPWEDAQIVAGYAAGALPSQIGVLIGRTLRGIMGRAAVLDLRHPNLPAGWSDAERLAALDLAREGLIYPRIVARLQALGFPARTAGALGLFIRKTGYLRGWGRPWTEDEEELLRRAYARGDSLTPLVEQLGRPRTSLRWKVEELGLQGTHPNHDGFRQGPVWTAADDAFVRAHYGRGRMPTPEIAEHIGRGRMAVCQRAAVLGLVHGYCRPWSEAELQALRIAYDASLSLTDLAEAVSRDVAVVHRKSLQLGLHFSQRVKKAPRTPRASRATLSLPQILAMQAPP